MGDWERTFGSYGMQDGGMGVIDGITADEKESSWNSKRGPAVQSFATWGEASAFARKHREWVIMKGEGTRPFLVKRDTTDAQKKKDKLAEQLTQDTLQLISQWPSGMAQAFDSCFYRRMLFKLWFQTFEEFIPSGSDGSASSLSYCAKYLCIQITNVMPGVKFTELIPFEVYTQPPTEFREWVDKILDRYEAPPAE